MNCKRCGFQLNENDQFCKNCGTPVDNISIKNNNERLENQTTKAYTQQQSVSQQPMKNYNGGLENQTTQTYMQQQSVSQQPMNNYNGSAMQEPSWTSGYNAQPMNQTTQTYTQQQSASQQPINNYNGPTMQQPSWTSEYNAQPTKQTSKNNNIIIGIIAVLVVAGIIVAIIVFGSNRSNNSENGDGGSLVVNDSNSAYTVNFKGFTFKIPTNLVYEIQSDAVHLGDEEGTWVACIEVIEGSYSQMLSKKSQLQIVYQSQGYTSSAAVEKTIGGMPFITLEISRSGKNALVGISKANSMNLFGITAYNVENEYDYKLLETVSSILSTAEYSGATNNMSVFEKPDMSGIAELAK